ncbi:MAG: MBL fold metallo-hydrolase [Clostridiales bacterium]|nr:MBL fold metallo-hydrolase [Clostridiales bacterium]
MERLPQQPWNREGCLLSHLKSRRIYWNVEEPPLREAYERLIRTVDTTRKIYAVNPYAEVYRMRKNVYGILTDSLDGYGDPWMFLIEGPKRALLIDTSFGLGDLKGLIRELIGDKPYDVANTHSHFDHAYGNYQFDRVYCHENEVYALQSAMNGQVWDYLFDENGNCKWTEFDRKDLIPFREYEIAGVPDGFVFPLGDGYEVELVFMPGHTCGHAAFLDKQNRILFGGDNVCFGTVGIGVPKQGDPNRKYATVEGFYEGLCRLIARRAEFDVVFPSHGMVDVDAGILEDLAATCKAVLDNPEDYNDRRVFLKNGKIPVTQYCRQIYESGYLTWQKGQIYYKDTMERDIAETCNGKRGKQNGT